MNSDYCESARDERIASGLADVQETQRLACVIATTSRWECKGARSLWLRSFADSTLPRTAGTPVSRCLGRHSSLTLLGKPSMRRGDVNKKTYIKYADRAAS